MAGKDVAASGEGGGRDEDTSLETAVPEEAKGWGVGGWWLRRWWVAEDDVS